MNRIEGRLDLEPKSFRLSNMELLRIFAMFLVLVVHADFFSLGAPTINDAYLNPIPTFTRYFFESISIVCVNVFILISGWFGLNPNLKSFGNFAFQCLFFLCGIYALVLLGGGDLSIKGIACCLAMTKWNWFIKAYIGLYILAPVLNTFIDHSTKNQLRNILIAFFIFQTLYAWLTGAAQFFEAGYSTMSFIGLYLLARYVKLYPNRYSALPRKYDLLIYLCIVSIITVLSFIGIRMGISIISGRMYSYVNPLVIGASLYLLLYFSKLNFNSKLINWIAASCFAVFLLHTNPNLCESYFTPTVRYIYDNFNGILCILQILGFLLLIYIIAIIIDQLRIVCWKRLWGVIECRHHSND